MGESDWRHLRYGLEAIGDGLKTMAAALFGAVFIAAILLYAYITAESGSEKETLDANYQERLDANSPE